MMRLSWEHRRRLIIAEARSLSVKTNLYSWTLRQIAERCNMSESGVKYYFPSALQLRNAVITTAIERQDRPILRQAKALNDPLVSDA